MRLKIIFQTALMVLMPLSALASDLYTSSATFTLSQQTMVPGSVLEPGSYSIQVLDHLNDRFIVRISQVGGGSKATFISVSDGNLSSSKGNGAVSWNAAPDSKVALRGFTFGKGAPKLEFVYPKDDAVALAKLNDSQVPAVDPASEGHSVQLSGLNKDEMQMITLWLLTPTKVGPGQNAEVQIKAAKLTQVASAKPPIARLPQTASMLPLVSLIGLFAAMGAAILAYRRLSAQQSA